MKPLRTAAVLGGGAVGAVLVEQLPRSGARAGVTGSDKQARGQLAALARRLGMTPVPIEDRSRALYHAAAVLAAGSQVALFSEALRAFRKATGAGEEQARAALLPLALG